VNTVILRHHGYTFAIITSIDHKAYIIANSIYIHIGKGTFTLPSGLSFATQYQLHHTGPYTIEYRTVDRDIEYSFNNIIVNMILQDQNGKDMFVFLANGLMRKTNIPLGPELKDAYGNVYDYVRKLENIDIVYS